jgi:hypothetical protein
MSAKLFVSGDASLNSNLVVGGNMSVVKDVVFQGKTHNNGIVTLDSELFAQARHCDSA